MPLRQINSKRVLISMDKNNTASVLREVKRLISINKLNDARMLIQPLIMEHRNDHRVFSLLGNIYHRQGEFSRAIKNYKTALDINSRDVETAINLALIYNDLGKYEQGAELYSKAINVMKDLEVANKTAMGNNEDTNSMFAAQHANLGELYLRYNRAEEALRELERALELAPESYKFYVELAEAFSRLGKRDIAIKKLNFVKAKRPDIYEARVKLGHLLFLEGEVGPAVEEWGAVLKDNPGNVEAKMYLKMAEDNSILP